MTKEQNLGAGFQKKAPFADHTGVEGIDEAEVRGCSDKCDYTARPIADLSNYVVGQFHILNSKLDDLHDVRPPPVENKGFPWWVTALALLGGFSVGYYLTNEDGNNEQDSR